MSALDHSDLTKFWQRAALPLPILIVGGGRWGKVWISVIANAQSTAKNICIVARTDAKSVRDWAKLNFNLSTILVYSSIAEAVTENPQLTAAIICSRPRNHLSDALEAYKYRLHVLVEKPMSINAAYNRLIATCSSEAQRVLAIGTEFAYLPALHQCANEFVNKRNGLKKISLTWEDPNIEVRHGSKKMRHEENGLLNDLLPHAFSIFRVFALNSRLNITHVLQSSCGFEGSIQFQDESSNLYQFNCNISSKQRTRFLEIKTNDHSATLDFSTEHSCLKINDCLIYPDSTTAQMTSTLRLELGAFVSQIAGSSKETNIDPTISGLLDLRYQLEHLISEPC